MCLVKNWQFGYIFKDKLTQQYMGNVDSIVSKWLCTKYFSSNRAHITMNLIKLFKKNETDHSWQIYVKENTQA